MTYYHLCDIFIIFSFKKYIHIIGLLFKRPSPRSGSALHHFFISLRIRHIIMTLINPQVKDSSDFFCLFENDSYVINNNSYRK